MILYDLQMGLNYFQYMHPFGKLIIKRTPHFETIPTLGIGKKLTNQPTNHAGLIHVSSGHYVLLKGHSAGAGKTPARLVSPVLHVTDPSCHISFAYYTSSEDSGNTF